ncbi:retrotransposon protein, putative, ty1-copia subclass [Tanacetum coccineum]
MANQGGRIQKVNKKSLNSKGKGKRKGNGKDKSYIPKPKNPKPSAKKHLTKLATTAKRWDYALETATRILNMVLTKKVDKTPYELWYGKVPNLSYLKVWGCEALVKRDTPDKLQQRSVKCIFIGYPKETMGYYFYFPPENKIVVARYAEFLKKNLISQEVSGKAG